VGAIDGVKVDKAVGRGDGWGVGMGDGFTVGDIDSLVGLLVGCADGLVECCPVGCLDGWVAGCRVGCELFELDDLC
jgi:hypothetical protein